MTPLAIRPQPGFDATVAAGRIVGLEIGGEPLFAVTPRAWSPPAPDTIDALLIGSANAIRHGGAALAQFSAKPTYVVGDATADAVRLAGYRVAMVGTGGLQSVLDGIGGKMRFLRPAGDDHIMLVPPPDITITTRVVYIVHALGPSPRFLAALEKGDALVLLHSARAARHLATVTRDRSRVLLAALGQRVANAAGTGWRDVRVARAANESALLSLARAMCE